jgi:hypothetical protein
MNEDSVEPWRLLGDSPTSLDRLDSIATLHHPATLGGNNPGRRVCAECGFLWPCKTYEMTGAQYGEQE